MAAGVRPRVLNGSAACWLLHGLGLRDADVRLVGRYQMFLRDIQYESRSQSDAVAVVRSGRQMTYAELDARANRFAHYLAVSAVGLLIYNGSLAAVLTVWSGAQYFAGAWPHLMEHAK